MVSFEELFQCDGVEFVTDEISGSIVVNRELKNVYFLSNCERLNGARGGVPNGDFKGYKYSWACNHSINCNRYLKSIPELANLRLVKEFKLRRI